MQRDQASRGTSGTTAAVSGSPFPELHHVFWQQLVMFKRAHAASVQKVRDTYFIITTQTGYFLCFYVRKHQRLCIVLFFFRFHKRNNTLNLHSSTHRHYKFVYCTLFPYYFNLLMLVVMQRAERVRPFCSRAGQTNGRNEFLSNVLLVMLSFINSLSQVRTNNTLFFFSFFF